MQLIHITCLLILPLLTVHDLNLVHSVQCRCNVIFLHIADENECELGINDCNPETSICVNTLGSFVCHCKKGFVLGVDGRTCEGK